MQSTREEDLPRITHQGIVTQPLLNGWHKVLPTSCKRPQRLQSKVQRTCTGCVQANTGAPAGKVQRSGECHERCHGKTTGQRGPQPGSDTSRDAAGEEEAGGGMEGETYAVVQKNGGSTDIRWCRLQ